MDIATSAQVLEAQGFTVVRQTRDEVLAVRLKFYWSCCMRMTTIARVQKAGHLTKADARESQKWVKANAGALDVSMVPRGFAQGRTIVDIFLADEADADVVKWASSTVDKFMGGAYHPVVVTAEATSHDNPIWGAAYWPFTKHLIQQVADGDTSGKDDPTAMMGLVIGLWMMWPGMLTILLGCCGIPGIYLPIAWSMEKKKLAALPEQYGGVEEPAQLEEAQQVAPVAAPPAPPAVPSAPPAPSAPVAPPVAPPTPPAPVAPPPIPPPASEILPDPDDE